MTQDCYSERQLFGGAISSAFALRFQDVSNIRQVPDHQEVFVDPNRDECLIFEILDLKNDVEDSGSAAWFLQDLIEQSAEGTIVIEQPGIIEADGLQFRNMPAIVTTAVGQMAISKGRQGREAQNIVRVYLANLRLKEVGTDVLITAYEPILIKGNSSVLNFDTSITIFSHGYIHTLVDKLTYFICPLSESARTVGAGLAVPAAQSGCMPMAEVFKLAVSSIKVHDWNLFGVGS